MTQDKPSLKEALDDVATDVASSPDWLKLIWQWNKALERRRGMAMPDERLPTPNTWMAL
jgi:hypothetical protein